MNGNDFVSVLIRSPFHALLGNTMLITVCGRRTGRMITTPVNYIRSGDVLWVLSTRTRTWWRNITPGKAVRLHLGGREVAGIAELVTNEGAVAAHLAQYVRQVPASASSMGIRLEGGVAHRADLERVARERLFVKICLAEGA